MNQVQMGQGCSMKVLSGRRVAGAIRSLVNARFCLKHCLYLFLCIGARECYRRRRRDLELGLKIWKTSELLDIRRMDRVPNARKESCAE